MSDVGGVRTGGSMVASWRALDRFELILAGSAVLLATNAHQHAPLLLVGAAFVAVMAVRPARLRSPAWWIGVALASFAIDATRPLRLDDHIVLTHYWALALGLSLLLAERPEDAVERNGRLLIGLTMAFAVGSKLAWGEFADGGFFEHTILLDDRFVWVASLAGIGDPQANYDTFGRLTAGGPPLALETTGLVATFALLLTAGTFLLEGGLALAYLVPGRGARLLQARTVLLVAFCVTTYAVVPVAGFGGILLVMSAADDRLDRRARLRRLAFAAVLYLWGLVWVGLH